MASAVRVFGITFAVMFISLMSWMWMMNWWKSRYQMESWLEENDLDEYYPVFNKAGKFVFPYIVHVFLS